MTGTFNMETAARGGNPSSIHTVLASIAIGVLFYIQDRNVSYAAGMVICLIAFFVALESWAPMIHVQRPSDKRILLAGCAVCGFLLWDAWIENDNSIPLIWKYIYFTGGVFFIAIGATLLKKWIPDEAEKPEQ
jgi:hypothetical protein